jgi:hypothetical protein
MIILSNFTVGELKRYLPMKINRQLGESPTSAKIGSVSYMPYTACTRRGRSSLHTDTTPWKKKKQVNTHEFFNGTVSTEMTTTWGME